MTVKEYIITIGCAQLDPAVELKVTSLTVDESKAPIINQLLAYVRSFAAASIWAQKYTLNDVLAFFGITGV